MLCVVTAFLVAAAPHVDMPARAMLADYLARERDDRGLPSVSSVVVSAEGELWSGSAGVLDDSKSTASEVDSLYRIASITKLFTGFTVLRLRDEGKLHLDDKLATHLPELRAIPGGADVTFLDTLNHRAGFPRDVPGDTTGGTRGFTSTELLEGLAKTKLAKPGLGKSEYSNFGVALVGLAIERITGRAFTDVVDEKLLGPLEMHCVWSRPKDRLAVSYVLGSDLRVPLEHHDKLATASAGGAYCSTRDLGKFAGFFLRAFSFKQGPADEAILRASSRREMLDAPLSWGAFRDSNSTGRTYDHEGRLDGYRSRIMLLTDLGYAVVVLMSGDGSPFDIARGVSRIVRGDAVSLEDVVMKADPIDTRAASARLRALATKRATPALVRAHYAKLSDVDAAVRDLAKEQPILRKCALDDVKQLGKLPRAFAWYHCADGDHLVEVSVEKEAPHRLISTTNVADVARPDG